MSIVSAIRSIRVILAESAPIATARNACLRFKSRLSNIPSQSLASRNVQAAQKTKAPPLSKEEVEEIKLKIQHRISYVQDNLRRNEFFRDGVQRVRNQLVLNEDEQEVFLEKAKDIKFEGLSVIVLQVMAEPYISQKLNDIVSDIESKFPGVSDGKFKEHIPDALKARGLVGEELKSFVKKAAWVVTGMVEGRPLDVLQVMFLKSKSLW